MNKIQEAKYSALFLSQVNKDNGWDYRVVPNQNEAVTDQEVDIYAESDTRERLQLQVKIIDKGHMPGVVSREKEADQNPNGASSIHIRDLDPIKWAKQTIAECNRHYEPTVRRKLVLLLCVYHGTEIDQEYMAREFVEYQDSDFKGIYLINPLRGLINGNREYSGQVTAIKALAL